MTEESPTKFAAIPDGLAQADYVQSLAKGLALLTAFGPAFPAMTSAEAANRIGVTRAAARRLLLTCEALGFVVRDGRQFRPAPKVLDLARAFLSSVSWIDAARGAMEALVNDLHETCSLLMLDGSDVVFVQRVEAVTRLLTVNVRIGTRMPALNTAGGRAIAAHLDSARREDLLATGFTPMTEKAARDPEELRAILETVRQDGFAIIDGEMEQGLRSIAVPILTPSGTPLGALAMLIQASRVSVEDLHGTFGPRLKAAATTLSASAGS
ncbi:MAG: IclR family transcriptional regulator C-terminal domain-containing protein [Pseudomonadota bacterium]